MVRMINLEALRNGCTDDAFDDGIRIDTELVPLGGPCYPVKPAICEGGTYQQDRRCRVNIHSKFEGCGVSRGWAPVRVRVPAGGDAEQENPGRSL